MVFLSINRAPVGLIREGFEIKLCRLLPTASVTTGLNSPMFLIFPSVLVVVFGGRIWGWFKYYWGSAELGCYVGPLLYYLVFKLG